jgi:hypothetical protein
LIVAYVLLSRIICRPYTSYARVMKTFSKSAQPK